MASKVYLVAAIFWLLFAMAASIAGNDWKFPLVMEMLCLVLFKLSEKD